MKHLLLLLIGCSLCIVTLARPIKGTVQCDGKPMSAVTVTDGYTFTQSDAKGLFTLDADDEALFISIVTPSGYLAPLREGIPQFYLPYNTSTKRYDFVLQRWEGSSECYELLAVADPQPKTEAHFDRLCKEIMPVLKAETTAKREEGVNQAMIILGDIVWDSPELFSRVKSEFAALGIPIYPVIGNHDHFQKKYTDREATENYRNHFGPTYYAFDMGRTHYIVLDDIEYHGERKYKEQIDSVQLRWAGAYAKLLPEGSRVCIAMHAPAMKAWRNNHVMESAQQLIAAFAGDELHFISGHTHINSNYDIAEGVMEHNVAQINGNLWRTPLNGDGTPKGYQLFSECGNNFTWEYQNLDKNPQHQIRLWLPGTVEKYPRSLIAKVWNWDSYWTVVWYEDGRYKGAMQRTMQLNDPDYEAYIDSLKESGKTVAPSWNPRPTNFYFRATPSKGAREITVVATDRFGRSFSEQIELPSEH